MIEQSTGGLTGVRLCPFSSFHHVNLPSILMNVDALLPPTTPKLDSKAVLNRTLSTAVPSPSSSPSRQLTESAPAEAARAACVIASCLRGWRNSDLSVPVRRATSATQPLCAFTRGRSEDCFVVAGGLAFALAGLEVEWQTSRLSLELSEDEELHMTQAELYSKVLASAKAVLDSETAADVPRLVAGEESDMSTVLAGAVLMNDSRDSCRF